MATRRVTQRDMAAMQQRIRMNYLLKTVKPAGVRPWKHDYRPPDELVTRVLVTGTRDFDDWNYFRKRMDRFCYWFDAVEVVIGSHGQRVEKNFEWADVGADALGKRWAEANWWVYKTFWADWENLGRKAGPVRNSEMVEYVAKWDGWCIAFWDGVSPGTADTIDKFRRYSPDRIKVYRYD